MYSTQSNHNESQNTYSAGLKEKIMQQQVQGIILTQRQTMFELLKS